VKKKEREELRDLLTDAARILVMFSAVDNHLILRDGSDLYVTDLAEELYHAAQRL
jgi:hypothetical protein